MNEELTTYEQFIDQEHITDHVPEMERTLDVAQQYFYRVGTLLNDCQEKLSIEEYQAIERYQFDDSMTETIRQKKIAHDTAERKKELQKLKLMFKSLDKIQRKLFQAIKTRRAER